MGPVLGGVLGRKAGSVADYNYSAALRGAGFVWSADNLDRWLTDPQAFVPGAKMPIRVLDEPSRRDLIAYLRQAGTAAAGGGSGS
jgi:cytochrome c2